MTRFNSQTFKEGIKREWCFTLADAEAVIDAPEFYHNGDAFTGVWQQVEMSAPPGRTAVLRVLAQSATGMPITGIVRGTGLTPEEIGRALETLKQHDVVMEVE